MILTMIMNSEVITIWRDPQKAASCRSHYNNLIKSSLRKLAMTMICLFLYLKEYSWWQNEVSMCISIQNSNLGIYNYLFNPRQTMFLINNSQ